MTQSTDLAAVSTAELKRELERRPDGLGRCPTCREKWPVFMSCSRSWTSEPHCYGCRRAVELCTCR